jgi:multidrug efflux pump subunit AcrB
MKQEMPLGYSAETMTYYWTGDEARKQYGLILLVIALVFLICSVLFESLRQPLAMVIIIPLSFTGIFLTFYWFDFSFDQGGYA